MKAQFFRLLNENIVWKLIDDLRKSVISSYLVFYDFIKKRQYVLLWKLPCFTRFYLLSILFQELT